MKKNYFIIGLFLLLFNQGYSQYYFQVSIIDALSGGQAYELNQASNPLSFNVYFCASGNSKPQNSTQYTITWYVNSVNSTVGGTSLGSTTKNTIPQYNLPDNLKYYPSTSQVGTYYYYAVLSNPSMKSCGFQESLVSTIQKVDVVSPATHLNFDGVDDKIELDNASNFNFTTDFSIECWIQVSSFTKEWQTIISKGTDGPRIHRYGNTDFIAFGTGGQDDLKSNTPLNDGNWHHIAATFNNGDKKLYIDGVLDATQTVDSPLEVNDRNVRIGSQSDDYSPDLRNFDGNIDEVRFWNVARAETEIKSSKNCELQGNETGLVAYYKFNEGAAAEDNTAIITLTDATPNANNGTLSGFEKTGTISNFLAGSPVRTGIAIPTAPTADAQIFCGTTTVASLVPAPSETTFWYEDNTTTAALSSTDTVITGTYYVATANANGCESARTAVDVTTLTAPTADAQIFCGTTTVASLVPAPSETTFWYLDNTTTSALSDTDTIEAGTYYVATTNANGCESLRTAVDVTFSAPAVITVQPKNQIFVEDQAVTFTVTATDVTSYQWELSPDGTEWFPLSDDITDPDVSGANSNSLTFSGANMFILSQFKFRVVLNAEACSVASEEVTVADTDKDLGTSSFQNTNFSYYPNPTNGILNIDNSKDIQQVTVFSVLGKLVQETKPNTSNAKVDLSSLAAGNYLVQVKTNEEIKTIKIVKK